MDIRVERNHAISHAVATIRAIHKKAGTTPRSLDAMKGVMLELGARPDHFSLADFPIRPEDGKSVIYRLSKEADDQFALYASVSSPGKLVPPHNHDTWAVTLGVHGDEHNVLYERTDAGGSHVAVAWIIAHKLGELKYSEMIRRIGFKPI